MNADDEFFLKLLETFKIEAEDHLKLMSEGLIALEKSTSKEQREPILISIYREAHSLKGAAHSVNQSSIRLVCQSLENVFALWKDGKLEPDVATFNVMYETLDLLGKELQKKADKKQIDAIITKLESVAKGNPVVEPAVKEVVSSNGEKTPAEKPIVVEEEQEVQEVEKPLEISADSYKEKVVRISANKLDRFLQEIEEMLMVKLTSHQQVLDFKNLQSKFSNFQKEFGRTLLELQVHQQTLFLGKSLRFDNDLLDKFVISMEAQQQGLKEIREQLSKMMKASRQNAHFVSPLVDSLLENMKNVLMQPINTLFEVLPRMVRDLSQQLGKEIQLELIGRNIEVDRRILEEIKDPIIHIVRNAIDHGIESKEERKKKKKPEKGTLKIIASETAGNSVEILIADDGMGMDVNKLKQKALSEGLITKQDIAKLDEQDAIKFAFHSGISTSEVVTDLSGRGLGLGIVSEKVDKLGGRIEIKTVKDQGTTFKIVLPLTLATFRGVLVSVAHQDYIVPTHAIKRIVKLKKKDIKKIENKETIVVDHHSVSFVHLADYFKLTKKKEDVTFYAIVVKAAEQMLALGVDQIKNEHEVLVKSLGKQCKRVKNFMAATVLEGGKIIAILNPSDIVKLSLKGSIGKASLEEVKNTSRKKVILLAEDTITTRLLFKNILETHGYHVITAVDGLEASELIKKVKVDLLMTDVEMPRMDGLSLVKTVKANPAFSKLPIIICSMRGSKEDRERGLELGVNAYLDKSEFNQKTLLELTQKLI